jgi:hypothetical protein
MAMLITKVFDAVHERVKKLFHPAMIDAKSPAIGKMAV